MVFDTPIIGGIPRIARPVDRRNVGPGLLPFFLALFKAVVMVVKQPPQWRPLGFRIWQQRLELWKMNKQL
jgi:hypothetical protein